MPEVLEIPEIQVIPFKRLMKRNGQLRKNRFQLLVSDKLQSLSEKKILPPEEPELPFDKWIMPPQPKGYLRCGSYEWF